MDDLVKVRLYIKLDLEFYFTDRIIPFSFTPPGFRLYFKDMESYGLIIANSDDKGFYTEGNPFYGIPLTADTYQMPKIAKIIKGNTLWFKNPKEPWHEPSHKTNPFSIGSRD